MGADVVHRSCARIDRMSRRTQRRPDRLFHVAGEDQSAAWPRNSELFIGLVGPIGVDLDRIVGAITAQLDRVGYKSETVHLTKILQVVDGYEAPASPADERYEFLIQKGDEFCERLERRDAMAILGVAEIEDVRAALETAGEERRAYIIRQLKRPEEITTYRRLYGENFVVVAATQPERIRCEALAKRIARENGRVTPNGEDVSRATALVERDEREELTHGQNLRDAFAMADLYVDPTDLNDLSDDVERFVDLLFERRVRTPTADEYAMFQAWGSALRSGSLARQVGCCVYDEMGAVVATGTNDVPKAFGGIYSEDDGDGDHRDHTLGHDPSDTRRREMLAEVLESIRERGWLAEDLETTSSEDLASEALTGSDPFLKKSRLNAVIEFVRAVHAEQAAIADAARRGVSLAYSQLAVTTFPCHECARLILASGIERVVYIEPYPKSLALDMYSDSISFEEDHEEKVPFVPFIGVAPSVYQRLFSLGSDRKTKDGTVIIRDGDGCQMRLTYNGSRVGIRESEASVLAVLGELVPPDGAEEPGVQSGDG